MDEFYREIGALQTQTEPLDELSNARIRARLTAECGAAPTAVEKKKRRLAVILIAAALVLTACTAAAVRYTDWFSYLSTSGSEENVQEMFDGMGMVIGETVADEETGVSVTLDGCLYDGRRLALALTVEGGAAAETVQETQLYYAAMDNRDLYLLSLTRQEAILKIMEEAGQMPTPEKIEQARWMVQDHIGTAYVRKDESRPGVLHLELLVDLQSVRPQDEVLLHLEDLTYRDEVIAPGTWEFTLTLPERTMGRYYQGEATAQTPDGTLTIYDVAVEPSYIQLSCDGPHQENGRNLQLKRIRLKDGTTVPFNGSETRAMTNEEDVMRLVAVECYYNDWQFVSPEDVEALCFNDDIWIELSDLESYIPEENES